jgi:ABC-type nickel/cobalt efflux system permease component RcnA
MRGGAWGIALGALALILYMFFSGLTQAWFEAVVVFVYDQQRGFSRDFSEGITALRKHEEGATWSLMVLGIVYGVFHAVGPGHGKAVISTYALTHETKMRRTISLSFAASLVQGLSAIIVVGVLSLLVSGSIRKFATRADDVLNPISFAAVAVIGMYLVVRGVNAWRSARATQLAHNHDHGHEQDHIHDENCGCGHSHMPTPEQVDEATNIWRAGAVALSVGIRPCTGAILVLVLAFAFGFHLSGIAAVLAMSLGTAITVSALAVGAQALRWPLGRVFGGFGVSTEWFTAGLMIAGGGVILLVGSTLLMGSLRTPSHPFF